MHPTGGYLDIHPSTRARSSHDNATTNDDDDAQQQNHGGDDGDGVVVPTPTPRDDGAPRDARRRSRRRNIHERYVTREKMNE